MYKSRSSETFIAGLILLVLAGCGGGGGGGGGGGDAAPPDYVGNTSQAVVTTTNASMLTANIIDSGDATGIIGGVSVENGDAMQDQSGGLIAHSRRLNRIVHDTLVRAGQAGSSQRPVTAVIPIDQADPCDGGNGSVRTSGTLADDGTGTLQVSFNNCMTDGVTVNGPATLRVDAAQVTFSVVPTDFTLSFSLITLRGGPGLSIDVRGFLRTLLGNGNNTETLSGNLVFRNNNTGETAKTENLVIVDVYDNILSPSSFTEVISGRVFHPVHGWVDITTPTLLVFGTVNQLFPDSGQLLLTGTNSTVLVTALNSTMAELQLDLDGVGGVDNTARLKWSDLTGPVGADLGDTDLDGMHNSWETVNGLDPTVDDAAGNKDGDAFTNLQEYLAGTAP